MRRCNVSRFARRHNLAGTAKRRRRLVNVVARMTRGGREDGYCYVATI